MITIRFFAMLKTVAGTDVKELSAGGRVTVGELKKRLSAELPAIAEAMASRSILVSVNQEFAHDDAVVKDGDEVAFLPPFSGG
jgi:molybdopterin converting factor subunit 1